MLTESTATKLVGSRSRPQRWTQKSFALCLILLFVGCTNARLSELPQSVVQATATGAFCSAPALEEGDISNIIFVVDMSGSNVRQLTPDNSGFTRTNATDLAGKRFQIIRDFLSTSCAKSNPKNRFAVVGFASDVVPGGNICTGTRLVSNTAVQAQVDELNKIQTTEPLDPPNVMRSTNYVSGIQCAANIVSSDVQALGAGAKQEAYHVFFLSDGGPTGSDGLLIPNTPVQLSGIYAAVQNLMSLATQVSDISLQPILYGADILKSFSKAEYDEAIAVMTQMAQVGQTIEDAVTDISKINICDLLTAGKRTPYMVTDFGIINMTATMKNGVLYADSDMDGIPDVEEIKRGFDPTTPRSYVNGNQALDGTCKLNAKDCVPQKACGKPNALGLTSCEVAAYSLSDGLDSDGDGLPDIVEFLKGTRPNDPSDKTTDVDGDGITNYLEVHFGRDPNYWDNDIDPSLTMQYHHDLSPTPIGNCPSFQQSWSFHIDNIPVIPTLATKITDSISQQVSYYTHAANENVIFIYYIIRQTNDSKTTPGQLYGQFLKISPNVPIQLGAFKRLGLINGQFSP